MQRWLAAGGYPGGRAQKKAKAHKLDFKTMTDKAVINMFTRFFEWYVEQGRPGDPFKKKEVSPHSTNTAAGTATAAAAGKQL